MGSLVDIKGIGEAYAQKLKAVGIATADALLETGASLQGRKTIATATGASDALVLRWVNLVDLARIKGVGVEFADFLEAVGVDTVPELAQRNPENLHQQLLKLNQDTKLVGRMPTKDEVKDWVEQAKQLPRAISY